MLDGIGETLSVEGRAEIPHAAIGLSHAIREALALGCKFRVAGYDIVVEGITTIPQRLPNVIRDNSRYLWELIAGEQDCAPQRLLDALGVTAVVAETRQALRSAVRSIISDLAIHGGPLALDFETCPLPQYAQPRPCVRFNKTGCVSDSQPGKESYKDPAGPDPHRARVAAAQLYAGGEHAFVFRGEALDMLLRSHWLRRQWLVAHNAGFEISFLQKYGYRLPKGRRAMGRVDCSEQAVGLCIGVGHGGERRSLQNAAAAMLGVTVTKDHQLSDWSAANLSPGQTAYAAGDPVVSRRLWDKAVDIMDVDGLWDAYELQRAAIVPIVDMEARGLMLDTVAHAALIDSWSRDLGEARKEYIKLTGSQPPKTDAETRKWLESVLPPGDLVKWKRTPKGALSVDKDLIGQLGHIPTARPVLGIRLKERLLATFGPGLLNHVSPATGRIHSSFLIAQTKAGRFSSRTPNLQNLPRDTDFRGCIVAADGCRLVCGDYSQIELRVAAYHSRDAALTAIFAEGGDVHTATAARIAGIPIDEVTKDQRNRAKAPNFGSLYGQQAQGLADTAFTQFGVEMSVLEAQSALDTFFAAYPDLHKHLIRNCGRSRRQGYIRIGVGRLVRAEWEGGYLRYSQCCNLPIQGHASDCMLLAIRRVYQHLRKAGIRGGLVATVHDELLLEVYEEDVDLASDILQREMVRAFELTFPGAPITNLIEVNSGRTWAQAKEKPLEEKHQPDKHSGEDTKTQPL